MDSNSYNFEGHNSGVNCIAVSNQKTLVLTCSEDGSARMWDVKSAEQLMVVDREHNFKAKDEVANISHFKYSHHQILMDSQ